MKTVVIVRTRDEERNIERFCSAYTWADKVLIADANSVDRTRELAKKFSNVEVRIFDNKKELQNGYSRNVHSDQINFLIDWAHEEQADWILFDDCDCWPNKILRESLPAILETTTFDYVFAVRLYLYKDEGHFPRLAQPIKAGVWETSLYGWRTTTGMRCLPDDDQCHQQFNFHPDKDKRENIMPPMCLLHNPWQDDEMIDKKLNFYRESGLIPGMLHPMEIGKRILEPLPEWAYA